MRQQPHKDTPHPRQETKRVAQNTAMITGMTVMKKTAVQKSVHTNQGDFLYTKLAKAQKSNENAAHRHNHRTTRHEKQSPFLHHEPEVSARSGT